MTIDLDQARSALEGERSRLVHQLEELGATETGELRSDIEFGGGFADAGAVTAERTEVLGLVKTLAERLREIDAALSQIAEGTYGTCVACGAEISPARLAARPESIYCVDCKSKT